MSNIMIVREAANEFLAAYYQAGEDFSAPEVLEKFAELEKMGQDALAPLCDILDELEARKVARKEKAQEYRVLAKKSEDDADRMKEYITAIMQSTGLSKLSLGEKTITLSKGRESVEIIDEKKVPEAYKRIVMTVKGTNIEALMAVFGDDVLNYKEEINKTDITAAHKAGVGVDGTEVVRKPYIIIKG